MPNYSQNIPFSGTFRNKIDEEAEREGIARDRQREYISAFCPIRSTYQIEQNVAQQLGLRGIISVHRRA